MPLTLQPTELSVDATADLLRIQPGTVRRRVASGELRSRRHGRSNVVVLDPHVDWLRAEDAGALLGLSAITVRAAIRRGDLMGRREGGRWRVRLDSVLEDQRASEEAIEAFTSGAAPPRSRPAPAHGPHRLTRSVYARIDGAHVEVLERVAGEHGSISAAIEAGLLALDEGIVSEAEVAELRVEHQLHRERAEANEAEARELRELVERQVVDVLYCPHCERFVGPGEWGYEEDEEGVSLYHQPHGHRRGGKLRSSTVLARRAKPSS